MEEASQREIDNTKKIIQEELETFETTEDRYWVEHARLNHGIFHVRRIIEELRKNKEVLKGFEITKFKFWLEYAIDNHGIEYVKKITEELRESREILIKLGMCGPNEKHWWECAIETHGIEYVRQKIKEVREARKKRVWFCSVLLVLMVAGLIYKSFLI